MVRKIICLTLFCLFFNFNSKTSCASTYEHDSVKRFIANILDVRDVSAFETVLRRHPKIIVWSLDGQLQAIIQQSNIHQLSKPLALELNKIPALIKFLQTNQLPDSILNKIKQDPEHTLSSDDLTLITQAIDCNKLSASFFQMIRHNIDHQIQTLAFSKTKMIQLLLSKEEGLDFSSAPEKISRFFTIVMTTYFDQISSAQKKKIIQDLLLLPNETTLEEQVMVLLNNTGPILQKAFQLFAHETKSNMLKTALNQLKTNVKPFPFEQAKAIISNALPEPMEHYFQLVSEYPLAAGTIGQVYDAIMTDDLTPIVIKVRRPDIQNIATHELALLRSLTEEPGILSIINNLADSFWEEFDFLNESNKIEQAKIYEAHYFGKTKVVKQIERLPRCDHLIFMEKAPGSIISANDQHIQEKIKALSNLLYEWFQEAIFGSGFFHADLHSGNIFFQLIKRHFFYFSHDYRLTLIDFGNIGELTRSQAKGIMKLIIGLRFQRTVLISQGLSSFISIPEHREEEFYQYINEINQHADLSVHQKITHLFNQSLILEANIAPHIILFFRSKKFIEDQLNELNAKIDQHHLKTKKVTIENIYEHVIKKNLYLDVWWTLGEAHTDHNAIIDNDVVFAILNHYLHL